MISRRFKPGELMPVEPPPQVGSWFAGVENTPGNIQAAPGWA